LSVALQSLICFSSSLCRPMALTHQSSAACIELVSFPWDTMRGYALSTGRCGLRCRRHG
jgi:hypothetical protein